MQATHSRPRQTPSAASQPREQAHWEGPLHRFILVVLFTGLIAALALVVAHRGPELAEQTLSRLSYPLTQAIEFTTHPIPYR